MAKNKSFTGARRSVGTPTLGKEAMFQLIRKAREANREAALAVPASHENTRCKYVKT